MNCLGSWRAERYWLQSPPLSCYMTGFLKIFLQGPTIALLLHGISYVAQCVCILTKAWLLFTLLLRIAYVELMVGKMEACTWVIYIAKSNNGSMEMTNHTSWSRLCTYVEGGWWNEILLLWISLSFICITWGHGYIYFFSFFSWTLMCPFFLLFFWVMLLGHAIIFSFFLYHPYLFWEILEREIIKHEVLFCGWMEWHSWLPV